ncbi:MAG TPA: M10 family metallopeptidase C-terminal domain-containing protein [Allosphingosinicella sp.]|jgi:Ca2+-binding RTX toxin-like protein|nr:M10 family metallopeptidase C-terminal domain-containing protein [Allosphingosinicella sp.]
MRKFGQNSFAPRFFTDNEPAGASGNDVYSRGFLASQAAARQIGLDAAAGGSKSGTGFSTGGLTGPGLTSGLLLLSSDDAGNGIGLAPGNPVVTVGAAPRIGTIGTLGDQDFYKVTLEAGKTYEIDLFGHVGGKSLVPLLDSYVEIYSASGTLLASADGGASTLLNVVNSGFDAVLIFQPTATGTYYINARGFGNEIGDYALSVNLVNPNAPGAYHPYYDPSSPLNAIDWGSQVNKVNQSARNPDGNEGTRSTSANGADPTGNAQGTPVYSSLLDIPALAAAQGKDITGKNVITIYFAKAGDLITSIEDPTAPGLPPVMLNVRDVQAFERAAVMTALGEFEKVADVVYLVVTDRAQADFTYTSYIGTPGPGVSLLGSMSPPDEPDEGLAQFNSGDERWNAINLAQGGFSFVTLIHEFGHGHGLAHPHDNGGHSGIMNGVVAEGAGVADYTTGDFDLNQGVFTMMSYEDGWQTSPYGNAPTDVGYGYLGGLMAFDIAAIQDKYGVNEDHATGNDTYVLKDVNAPGTYYSSIWDGGGTDEIVYSGSRDANIDLRQATLQYEVGGGGFVSYAYGIFGGFTIANGVTIENATSGGGNDTLRGNAAANRLDAGAGSDILQGDGGADLLIGGAGADTFRYASPSDSGGGAVDHIADFAAGLDKIDLTGIDANSNAAGDQAFAWIGSNAFSGSAGQLRAYQSGGDWFVEGDTNGDGNADLVIQVTVTGGPLAQSDFLP